MGPCSPRDNNALDPLIAIALSSPRKFTSDENTRLEKAAQMENAAKHAEIAFDYPEMPEGLPLAKGIEILSPALVHGLVRDGQCLLIDVRGSDRAAGVISGSIHIPAMNVQQPFPARVSELVQQYRDTRLIVFLCQFCKHRAPFCANMFRDATDKAGNPMQRVAIMEGGFRGWQKLGLPVQNVGGASQLAAADAFARKQGGLICQGMHTKAT